MASVFNYYKEMVACCIVLLEEYQSALCLEESKGVSVNKRYSSIFYSIVTTCRPYILYFITTWFLFTKYIGV